MTKFSIFLACSSMLTVMGQSIRGSSQTVVADEGIAITNAHSGRRLYAQRNKKGGDGVGGGTGKYYSDQKWHFVESECPTQYGIVTKDDTCYEITNAYSKRRLYAFDNQDGRNGIGAGKGWKSDDQKWILQEDDCGVDDRCFLIVNARSGRRFYAQSGMTWTNGIGATSVGPVYDDQKWYIDIILPGDLVVPCLEPEKLELGDDCEADSIKNTIADYLDSAACPHGVEEEIKAWTQEFDYGEALLELSNSCKGLKTCLTGWHEFTMEGCTYQKIVKNVKKFIPDCDHDAETELQYWTSAKTKQESREKIDLICGQGWDTVPQSAFTDINTDFEDDFMNEYVSGRTYLNTETGSFEDTEVGNAISSFRQSEAASSVLQSVPNLEKCELQSIMCCFGRDRQPNDNNGNCAEPLDDKCVNADPMDNSNLCFLNEEFGHSPVFPGETEGDIHCHGLAWAEDVNDFTSQLRYNNFFFVSLFDHMYQRGYVESMVDSPDIPMCACIEDMQPVSRSDCTQIDATLDFTVSLDNNGKLIAMPVDVNALEVEFNSCKGTNPSNGKNQNNDLASYVHRLHNNEKISAETQDAIFDILVGHDEPNNNSNEESCAAAYEEATGQSNPEGIAITNVRSGRKLYAEEGKRFESGFGASNSAELAKNQKWYFIKSSCDDGAFAPVGADCYEILNAASDRRIYAQARKSWQRGVGASTKYVYPNQKWTLEETSYNGDRAYFLVNADSGRRLYAQVDKVGEDGVGAGVGTKYDDQKWFIDLENNYIDVTMQNNLFSH